MYYVYIASSSFFRALGVVKLGCTQEPYCRLSTYLTGCPPGLTPSHDMEFDGVWLTTATCRDDLFDFEDELHNCFLRHRMMREKPGDSEWFNFQDVNALEVVSTFLSSRPWVLRQIPLSEILPPKRPTPYLRKQYAKNLHFIRKQGARNEVLNLLQAPVIAAIAGFVGNPGVQARTVIAPCGSGKTTMTAVGIRGVQRCIICCPSKQIQDQWRATLVAAGTFQASHIHLIGGAGTTNSQKIASLFQQSTYCLITTYMSSPLLVEHLASSAPLIISDEAHHMAGIVGTKEGPTRWLFQRASELGVKRLSLTFTPRYVVGYQCLSMDDESLFGPVLAELKLRDLIRAGVLPDYRLWTLRDESRKGAGIQGKAECLLEAWDATEVTRGEEKHILHHLIVFAATTQEARDLEAIFRDRLAAAEQTLVLRVEQGDALDAPLAAFAAAPRAILVNCLVLNEGVDVPCANAVAITYPKQARGQITQMVLRAGRWYENKPVFHILLPTLGEEDLSGFEEVLAALASCDEQIHDEIVLRAAKEKASASLDSEAISLAAADAKPECIMIEEYEADAEAIRRCFHNLRRSFYATSGRRIQTLCTEKGIGTSIEYALLRSQELPELPEDPRPKGTTWYDFLNSQHIDRPTPAAFVATILEPHNLRIGHMYDAWRSLQPTDVWARLPTVQNISDGFFGADENNFDALLRKYGRRGIVRGR